MILSQNKEGLEGEREGPRKEDKSGRGRENEKQNCKRGFVSCSSSPWASFKLLMCLRIYNILDPSTDSL